MGHRLELLDVPVIGVKRRVSTRLPAETIERLVAEYAGGATAAELSQRYGLAKNSVIRLVRQAGKQVRHPRLSSSELARLVVLFQAGLTQRDIAEQLDRSPSAVWHCLRRLGLL
jgi:DNA-binding transcriptional regulator LsrR (DeoR family)